MLLTHPSRWIPVDLMLLALAALDSQLEHFQQPAAPVQSLNLAFGLASGMVEPALDILVGPVGAVH